MEAPPLTSVDAYWINLCMDAYENGIDFAIKYWCDGQYKPSVIANIREFKIMMNEAIKIKHDSEKDLKEINQKNLNEMQYRQQQRRGGRL